MSSFIFLHLYVNLLMFDQMCSHTHISSTWVDISERNNQSASKPLFLKWIKIWTLVNIHYFFFFEVSRNCISEPHLNHCIKCVLFFWTVIDNFIILSFILEIHRVIWLWLYFNKINNSLLRNTSCPMEIECFQKGCYSEC